MPKPAEALPDEEWAERLEEATAKLHVLVKAKETGLASWWRLVGDQMDTVMEVWRDG